MAPNADSKMEQALELMSQAPLIDGHNDWIHMIRAYYDSQLDDRFHPEKSLGGHVDLKRLVEGKAGAVFWSVYVNCPEDDGFSDEVHFEALRDTLQQIDMFYRVVDLYSHRLEIVDSSDDIMRIFRQGKCASLLGAEGLHQIANSGSVLRILHRLGVRYVTLAHGKNNLYVDSATSAAPAHHGLSAAGRDMIREMNRIGMIVDLSHTSEAVMLQVLEMSLAPVIFSHSSAYGVVPHPRNVPDGVLDKLKEKGGVIMISFIPWITHADGDKATINHVVDHILYVARRIGFDHLGLGSDFDGMPKSVAGLEDVSKYPALVAKMLARGVAPDDAKKVMGLNVIRVMKQVEEVARENSAKLPVLEDPVKQLWNDDIRAYVRREYPHAEHDRPRN
ncbi:renal dipeptidase family [Chaetomidium leptoderma]|uniref:Dipeptidase n=1 Tax=Chaetomidium leptoderma TaxID=669021 RepID=A0AAN6ZXK0_9PEZI|nr:renal dipeptidase family [Chaetomidium leptoderma]